MSYDDKREEEKVIGNETKNEPEVCKLNIPYNKVAMRVLMERNGLSKEEAEKFILEHDFDEIESQVFAKQSIKYVILGINKIYKRFNVEGRSISKPLLNTVFTGIFGKILRDKSYSKRVFEESKEKNYIKPWVESPDSIRAKNIIEVLSTVHDGWVMDNQKGFFSRDKKYKHMPIELIGWKEAKEYLLFVEPILESIGIEVNESDLEQAYNKRVKQFFLDKDIKSEDDLIDQISKGTEFYPALNGQEDVIEALSDKKFVEESIISQIKGKGIGSVDSVRKGIIVEQIVKGSPDSLNEDAKKLTEDEVLLVESLIDEKNRNLEEEYNELTEKERAIQRIKKKIELHKILSEKVRKLREEQENKANTQR